VKVVSSSIYDDIKEKALNIRTKKIQYYKQRIMLKRLLSRLSQELIAVTRPSMNVQRKSITSIDESTTTTGSISSSAGNIYKYLPTEDNKQLLQQIEKLTNEKLSLQQALSEAESALVYERTACAESMRVYENISNVKDNLLEEICELRNELDNVKLEYQEYVQQQQDTYAYNHDNIISDMNVLINSEINKEVIEHKGFAILHFQPLLEYSKNMSKLFVELQQSYLSLEQNINKLKLERKQLKQYGIQSKEKIEVLESSLARAEHERELAGKECSMLHSRIEVLEKTIAQYREVAATADLGLYGKLKEKIDGGNNGTISSDGVGNEGMQVSSGLDDSSGASSSNVGVDAISGNNESVVNPSTSVANIFNPPPATTTSRIIVHDFSKVEPDEVSQYLDAMASSLKEMLPSWDSLMGNDDEEEEQDTSTSSSNSMYSAFKGMSFGF
jgi:chromosome segregation ATPase